MSLPLISICIVTYNHQDYIEDCLYSVLSQKGDFTLEILIGDDASNDNTAKIVNKIAEQNKGVVTVFKHEKNLGASRNYHFLINQAKGDYIAHLDGDDFWLSGKLNAQLSFLEDDNTCIACYTNAVVVTDNKEPRGFFNYPQEKYIPLEKLLKKGNFLNHSSLLYHKRGKEIILGFPAEFIDFQTHLNLGQQGKLGYLNQALVTYRVNSNNSMLKVMPEKVMLLYCQALLSQKHKVPDKLFQIAVNNYIKSIFISLVISKQHKTLIKILKILKEEKVLSTQSTLVLASSSVFFEMKNLFKKILKKNHLQILQKNN